MDFWVKLGVVVLHEGFIAEMCVNVLMCKTKVDTSETGNFSEKGGPYSRVGGINLN